MSKQPRSHSHFYKQFVLNSFEVGHSFTAITVSQFVADISIDVFNPNWEDVIDFCCMLCVEKQGHTGCNLLYFVVFFFSGGVISMLDEPDIQLKVMKVFFISIVFFSHLLVLVKYQISILNKSVCCLCVSSRNVLKRILLNIHSLHVL